MASIEIMSAKIKGKIATVDYSYEERTENSGQTVDVSSDTPAHDDLRKSFRQLVPHLAFMCEEVDNSEMLAEVMDDIMEIPEAHPLMPRMDKYKVTSFKITGAGDTEGVVLSGQKKLSNGKSVNLNTPNLKWDDDYEYNQELMAAIDKCRTEVILYMEGKRAPELQQSLFDQDEENIETNLEA